MEHFLFFLPIATALAVTLLRFTELGTKRDLVPGPVAEKTTFRLFIINGLAVLAVALTEYVLRSKSLEILPFAIGISLAVSSFIIRRKAIAALGRYWSLHVEIREDHKFVKDGPFRWVRHPTYFSMILELLSGLFILNSYYAGIIIIVFFFPILIARIKIEEKALINHFKDDYLQYINSTPAIFPWKMPTKDTK